MTRKNEIDRIANEESQKAVSDINTGLCYKCRCETVWRVAPMLVRRHGKIYFGYKCTECGTMVPDFAWGQYQRNGEIVIPTIPVTC